MSPLTRRDIVRRRLGFILDASTPLPSTCPCRGTGFGPARVPGPGRGMVPLVFLGSSGGLLGAADGVFLKVDGLLLLLSGLERFRSLPAQVHRSLGGPDPLQQLPEKPLDLGPPIVLIRLKKAISTAALRSPVRFWICDRSAKPVIIVAWERRWGMGLALFLRR